MWRWFDRIAAPLLGATFIALSLIERRRPLRRATQRRSSRLAANLAVAAVGAVVVRALIIPRLDSQSPKSGLSVRDLICLDATMYAWHRANHTVPALYRFHRFHHADRDLDASTALRFHPVELLASVPIRALQTRLIAPSPATALLYEALMEGAAMFHHSNVRLPLGLERALGWLVVTPRMHQIHHSVVREEGHANWSVVLSIWDRLLGTYRDQPTERSLIIGPVS